MTTFLQVQEHLDKLPDKKLIECLKIVVGFQVFDARIETWRRRREAEKFIAQIKAKKPPYDAIRKFLHSCAESGFSETDSAQFLQVQP